MFSVNPNRAENHTRSGWHTSSTLPTRARSGSARAR